MNIYKILKQINNRSAGHILCVCKQLDGWGSL